MKIKFKQLTINDIYADIQFSFEENKHKFVELYDSFVDLSEIIPCSLCDHYYFNYNRPRDFSLNSTLSASIIQKILSVPNVQLLVDNLNLSKELRDLCVAAN
jgi:hypothetical protein